MLNFNEKIIFNKLFIDVTKFLLLISLSLSLIIWVVQAVNFLDYISEDGHGLKTYFSITFLSFPKIFTRILPFSIFIAIFYILNKYELKNELIIYWNIGIKKIRFINNLIIFSIILLFFQLFFKIFLVPNSLDLSRDYIRNSNIDFFPNLIKEKKFIDSVKNLTIFVEKKNKDGELKNIYLKDQLNFKKAQIIYAKKGRFSFKDNNNYLMLNDGSFIDVDDKKITSFAFKKTKINLSKYLTKTTTFPKIQEVKSKHLLICLYNLYLNKNFKSSTDYLTCNKKSEGDITEEIFKRIVKPFFIPTIVLIASLIILFNKDHFNYSKIKFILFFIGFFVLIVSEISARYITKSSVQISFLSLPIIMFLLSYLYLLFKLKTKL